MLAQLYAQRERQAAQACQETVARGDLEAMVLRIEQHFKVRGTFFPDVANNKRVQSLDFETFAIRSLVYSTLNGE